METQGKGEYFKVVNLVANDNKGKEIPPINSVTDHYQKIMGHPAKIYSNENTYKWLIALLVVMLILFAGLVLYYLLFVDTTNYNADYNTDRKEPVTPALRVEKLVIESDQDGDGIFDLDDILQGARIEVENQPQYKSAYYSGGYPPAEEGVCTDVIWRAYKNAGFDLKGLIDKDIKDNIRDYPRVNGKQDRNIDFRRVPNLLVFFKKHGENLTLELKPNDPLNLREWQRGDIVIYGAPLWHIAIVSDKRRSDGVPYIIHNAGPTPREEDYILKWSSPMLGHFRFPNPGEL